MKIGFLSLGCPKNLVDGEVMLGMAREAGHEITTDAADADVLVVNTCAFIDSAKQESIDAILEMAAQKRDGRCSRLVVTGCLAERYRDELRSEIPEIDAVLGTGEVPRILDAIGTRGSGLGLGRDPGSSRTPRCPLTFFRDRRGIRIAAPERARPGSRIPDPGSRRSPTYLYDADTPRYLTTPKHFAYVKIAEGCDYTCAFCIIPTLRGSYRSRDGRARSSARRGRSPSAGSASCCSSRRTRRSSASTAASAARSARLLRELNAIDGLAWIRLLYLYPTTITDDVLAAMAECEKVCRYIDLPLQHASADVLKRMRRPGNRRTYDKLLGPDHGDRVPDVTLRTTLIVGFPGETDADFAELEGFVADTGFDHLGVFTYSHEEGTRAFGLADDVPAGGEAPATKCADGASKEDSGAGAQGADRHARSRCSSTARRRSTRWCCRGGSRGRRPTSTRSST